MNYQVTPEFKTQVAEILATQKFSTVFPYMNLINREGFNYTEEELNSLVQFVGEFPYSAVAEFFTTLASHVNQEDNLNAVEPSVENTFENTVEATETIEATETVEATEA